jgi:sigma-B regulation protein RsbU (phosphoserine phosphatase)
MRAVNEDFRSIFGARSFMTAMCVALEPKTGRASVVGAGHPPLLVARHRGAAEQIPSLAPPLGVAQPAQFSETIVDFRPGDAFVLYTDGIFGGRARATGRLTPQRLVENLDVCAPTAQALLTQLLRHSAQRDENQPAVDDVTAVVVRRASEQILEKK